jgi:hypothetical protein
VSRRLGLGALGALLLLGRPLAAQPSAAPPLPEVRKTVAEVFSPRRYEFCHTPDYPLTPAEKRWCELGAGANTAACPTLAEACRHDATARQVEVEEPITIRVPQLPLPLRFFLWALLAAGLAIGLVALIRHFLDRRRQTVVTTAAPATAEDEQAAARAREVETDVQRLVERAQQEAAAGDFRAAIGSVYAALLRRLEGAGVLRIEPDQTNGDYLHRVKRERPAMVGRLAEVVSEVEVAQFGEPAVTRASFDGVWLRVTALLAERMAIVLALLGLLASAACGPPRADWEHSPSGRAGVIAFLGKRGFVVRERLLSVAKLGKASEPKAAPGASHRSEPGGAKPGAGPVTQLVLLPAAQLRDDDWQGLKSWIDQGGRSLIVAGGKRPLPAWIGARVVERQAMASASVTPADAEAKPRGPLVVRVPGGNLVEGTAGSHPLLRRGPSVYASERWLGPTGGNDEEADEEGTISRVVVLADDFLFRNASLLCADNAAALDALLRDGGSSVELAGDLTGLVSSNPIQSVQRGRLGPALLQLTAFLLLFFVCRGARFGRPLPTQRSARREFAEHVRALGLHYARARAERVALAALGAYAIERLRERCGLHVDRSLSGLAEAVAARSGRPVGEVMRMLLEARDAGKGVPADKDARDLETAWQMCRLLEATGGTGGHQRIPSHV